jgi:hypothetical protein
VDPDSIRSVDPYPDPDSKSGSGSGSRRAKLTTKMEKIYNFMFFKASSEAWTSFMEA